jgi:hypothetical protein
MLRGALLSLALAATLFAAGAIEETTYVPYDHPAIQYVAKPANDPVARLQKQIDSGAVKLDYTPGFSYLPALLKALHINVDSQVLVFSKTSFQSAKISPRTPRALYFNDDAAVGFVQDGEVLEVVGLDPQQGVNFYTLGFEKDEHPEFARRDVCLQCHQGLSTLGVPGILVSSVYPAADGMPAFRGQAMITDHRSAFDQRWGGWYVTGTHGSMTHMGNAVGHDPARPQLLDTQGTQNLTSLEKRFDTSKYLLPTSDIVALMTLEHQTRMTDLMTRIGWDTRIAQHDSKLEDAHLNDEIEEMVTYMLFQDERPIREPIQGVSSFTKTFPDRGPRDTQGRSLRDFDLKTRMFKYPLTYMIYSAAFDGMPDIVRDRVYQRLYAILSGKDQSDKYAKLSADDRKNILEIVRDTKPNLPAYWK